MASFLKSLYLLTELDLSNNFQEASKDAYDDHHFINVSNVICIYNCNLKILRLVKFVCTYMEHTDNFLVIVSAGCASNSLSCHMLYCRFSGCELDGAWVTVASLLKSRKSLTELDLSNNDLGNGPHDESDDYLFSHIHNSSLQILRFVKFVCTGHLQSHSP